MDVSNHVQFSRSLTSLFGANRESGSPAFVRAYLIPDRLPNARRPMQVNRLTAGEMDVAVGIVLGNKAVCLEHDTYHSGCLHSSPIIKRATRVLPGGSRVSLPSFDGR